MKIGIMSTYKRIKTTCAWCNIQVSTSSKTPICSQKCYKAYEKKHGRISNNPLSINTLKCSMCNGKVVIPKSVQESSSTGWVFCNKKCLTEFRKTKKWVNAVITEKTREKHSKNNSGKNNPNYGNKWSMQQRKRASEYQKEKIKENPEEFKNRFVHSLRRVMEEKGKWTPIHKKPIRDSYCYLCEWIEPMWNYASTKEKRLISKFGTYNSSTNIIGICRDHKYSRHEGFKNRVFPEILRHPANCQFLLQSENASKKDGCHISLQQLFEKIENYNKSWVEQDLTLQKIKEYKLGKRWRKPRNRKEA